jgi:outer membrane protein assembly factor BamB
LGGRLYVPGLDGRLTALDAATGEVLWATEPTNSEGLNSIATDAAIIMAAENAGIQTLNPENGEVLWSLDQPVWGTHSPHAGGSTVYVHSGEDTYTALSIADGSVLGTTDQAAGAGSTAAVSGELLFVSGFDGTVRAFGPVDGEANVVMAASPALIATPEPESASGETEQTAVDAPAAGEMSADLVFSFEYPEGRFPAGVFEDPEGRLWSLVFESGSIDVYDRDFNLVESWSYGRGSGPDQFDWFAATASWVAGGIVWTPDGTAHVTDMANARVQMIGPDGTMLGSWGSKGDGDGQFQNPVAIALTAENEFVVADLTRNDVQWFDQDGNLLRRLTGPDDDTQFGGPVDIGLDPDGNLWVLDDVGQVYKFDHNNQLLLSVGHKFEHASPGHFLDPCCIDIDEQGRVWVADQWNRRIQVFDPNGNLLAVWDGCATEAGCLMNTSYPIIAGNGFFYLTDWDPEGLKPAHMHKFRITFMPEVPILEAATPAAEE